MKKFLSLVLVFAIFTSFTGCSLFVSEEVITAAALETSELIAKISSDNPVQEDIDAARASYDALSDQAKEYVENYNSLEIAEEKLLKLNTEAAKVTSELIAKISLDNPVQEDIDAARASYDALSDQAKMLVKNFNTLENAEKKINEAALKAEAEQLINDNIDKFKVTTDKVEGYTWYQHKTFPKYINLRSYILPYIGSKNGIHWMCIDFNYTGDEWIFYEEIIMQIDGKSYNINPGYYNVKRDNGNGDVWETYTIITQQGSSALLSNEVLILMEISNSKEAIVRFKGDNRQKDITISAKDKQAIKDTLQLYTGLTLQ